MILVDTSIWIDHLRARLEPLARALESNSVVTHPFVVGELALGSLGPKRAEFLISLGLLPVAPMARDAEVLELIAAHRLAGSGIGYVDAHLLASARIAGADIWTLDSALTRVAQRLSTLHRPA